MRAIFGLHYVRAHNFDTEIKTLFNQDTARVLFLEVWRKLQQELQKYSINFLAYEILNERWAKDPDDWNNFFL